MQAQDYAGAKWALAQRAQRCSDVDIDDALARGTLVRTHVMRPTWHLVGATDVR